MKLTGVVTAVILTTSVASGCATDTKSKYASLDELSDTDRNNALKECFLEENKTDRQDCIAKYADPAISYKCERTQVTGTRLGTRGCSTKRQRD